jgi:hypothetical protein
LSDDGEVMATWIGGVEQDALGEDYGHTVVSGVG